jgi:outer membrane protein assembly factor BamB
MPRIADAIQWLTGLLTLLLGACASVDEARIPAELTPIRTTLDVRSEWNVAAGDGVDAWYLKLNPMLVGNYLYVIDAQGTVTSIQASDGELIWQRVLNVAVNAGLQRGDGALFLGTENGVVLALSQSDGHRLWREQLGAEVMALSNSNLGVMVARTADSQLYGLDARSGEILWQSSRSTPVLNLRGASQPVGESGRIIVGFDDGQLVALSPVRGNVLWTTTIANPVGISELERLVDMDGVIKVVDGIIYVAAYHGRVAAVTLSEGRILWARKLSSHMGLDIDAEHVYVTDEDSYIWAFDRVSGATLWKQDKLNNREITAPVVIDEYVVVGDFEGYTHWLSKYDGHFVARSQIGSTGILTAPLVVDKTAYVLDRGGQLAALRIAASDQERLTPQVQKPSATEGLRSLEMKPFPESEQLSP